MQNNEFDEAVDKAETPTVPALQEGAEVVDSMDGDAPAADTTVKPVVTAPVVAPVAKPAAPTATKDIPHIKDASELELSPRALATKRKLAAEQKIMMIVPLDFGEKMGAVKTVSINGYPFEIKKNVPVNLPMSVANLIMNSQKISAENRAMHPLNMSNAGADRKAALG